MIGDARRERSARGGRGRGGAGASARAGSPVPGVRGPRVAPRRGGHHALGPRTTPWWGLRRRPRPRSAPRASAGPGRGGRSRGGRRCRPRGRRALRRPGPRGERRIHDSDLIRGEDGKAMSVASGQRRSAGECDGPPASMCVRRIGWSVRGGDGLIGDRAARTSGRPFLRGVDVTRRNVGQSHGVIGCSTERERYEPSPWWRS